MVDPGMFYAGTHRFDNWSLVTDCETISLIYCVPVLLFISIAIALS